MRLPTRRLNSVDLPTLGRPTSATIGSASLALMRDAGTWASVCQAVSKRLAWALLRHPTLQTLRRRHRIRNRPACGGSVANPGPRARTVRDERARQAAPRAPGEHA